MGENLIFGSDIDLPTLPGLKSNCENELKLLMKEIDVAFQTKTEDLRNELKAVRILCRSQRDEIENLMKALDSVNSNTEVKPVLEERIEHAEELNARLIEENVLLKRENNDLKKKVDYLVRNETRIEPFKSTYIDLQEENKILKEQLSVLTHKLSLLEGKFQIFMGTAQSEEHKESYRQPEGVPHPTEYQVNENELDLLLDKGPESELHLDADDLRQILNI